MAVIHKRKCEHQNSKNAEGTQLVGQLDVRMGRPQA